MTVPLVVSLMTAAVIYRWFSLPILQFGRSTGAAKK
jgi:hypothetical protein